MPVQTPSIEVSPYQSSVPTVQIPPEQFGGAQPAQPLQGQFGGKLGTPKLAIGDALIKGFLQGHAYKEEKKQAQAQATIAAADAAVNAAYQKYQDSLVTAQGDVRNKDAQAAYQAYVDTFNQGKEAKAKFVIPEKPQKGQKGQKSQDGQKKTGPINSIKDFFEANPHVVPQIALMTMQPRPQGYSAETQQAQAKLAGQQAETGYYQTLNEEAKRKSDAEQVVSQFGGLNEKEWAAIPPDRRDAAQQQLRNAQSYLETISGREKSNIYTDGKGSYIQVGPGQQPPPGYSPYQKPTGAAKLYRLATGKYQYLRPDDPEAQNAEPVVTTGVARPGTNGFYVQQFAKENGVSVDELSTEALDYIARKQAWNHAAGALTGSKTTPTVDYTTTVRMIGPEPAPPQGMKPLTIQPEAPGGMTPPPQNAPGVVRAGITRPPSQAAPAARTRPAMTRPPAAPASPSLNRTRMTQHVNDEKVSKYKDAARVRDNHLLANAKNYPDPNSKERKDADTAVHKQYDDTAQGIESWYNQQVHSLGGTVPSDKKDWKYWAQDDKGNVYGSDDNKSFYNTKTGSPYTPGQ